MSDSCCWADVCTVCKMCSATKSMSGRTRSKLDIIETIQRVIKALILTSRLGLDYLFKFTMTSDRCEGVKTQHERADVHQSLHSPHSSKGWPGNKRLTEW